MENYSPLSMPVKDRLIIDISSEVTYLATMYSEELVSEDYGIFSKGSLIPIIIDDTITTDTTNKEILTLLKSKLRGITLAKFKQRLVNKEIVIAKQYNTTVTNLIYDVIQGYIYSLSKVQNLYESNPVYKDDIVVYHKGHSVEYMLEAEEYFKPCTHNIINNIETVLSALLETVYHYCSNKSANLIVAEAHSSNTLIINNYGDLRAIRYSNIIWYNTLYHDHS